MWIDCGGDHVRFAHGGSENLDCIPDDGSCSSIHGAYNKWVRNLAFDISREVTKQRALRSPPDV